MHIYLNVYNIRRNQINKNIQVITSHIVYGNSYVLQIMFWNGLGKATEWEG